MKHFTTIEKLDTGILDALELASSISVLLLAFGLIASMANVLTKGAILSGLETHSPPLFVLTTHPGRQHFFLSILPAIVRLLPGTH